MNFELLICDPVLQLNVLVWMAKEQPSEGYRVRPLFFEQGFGIIYIEQPFPLPAEVSEAASNSVLDISVNPEPELILGRRSDRRALYFEAKAGSFSPASSNAKQARGHLLATGPAFQEVLAPLKSSLLCYLVPEDNRTGMLACLTTLSQELRAEAFQPGNFSCHGLNVAGGALTYTWDSAFKGYIGASDNNAVVIDELEPDTDPSPLLLVFSDEDCPNPERRDFYRRVVIEQVRARLLCDLRNLSGNEEDEITADGLLVQTTDDVFKYLGRERQKGLRLLVRENLFKRIREYLVLKGIEVDLQSNRLKVRWPSTAAREEFLDWLEDRRTRFVTERPLERTEPLFENLPETLEDKE